MALPALVSLEDFTTRVGAIPEVDEGRAQACLDDASALIRAEAAPEDWVDDSNALEDVPPVIVTVCCAVALRAFRNPDGVRSEGIGDYSVTYADTSTAVHLTDADRRLIRRAAGKSLLGSVPLQGEWDVFNVAAYVPVEGGGDEFPLGVPEGETGWRLSSSS